MPYWTVEEQRKLAEMLPKAANLEDLAKALNRSPDAVAMKLKRMGLQAPSRKTENCSVKNSENKVTINATTTPRLEPVPFKELPPANEMMGLLVAAIRRLQEPDVSPAEAKKLRLLIQAAKSYINLEAGVVLRLRHMESDMLAEWRHLAVIYEREAERAHSEEEKAKWKALLQEAQQHIKEFLDMGVRDPKKVKEGFTG